MSDKTTERANLAEADQHIAEGKARIDRQMLLASKLRTDGHDATGAENSLVHMRDALAAWYEQRQQVMVALGRAD
jgi:hypothetical protein